MGGLCSSKRPVYVPLHAIDERLIKALKQLEAEATAARAKSKAKPFTFDRAAMQFSRVKRVFDKMRATFQHFDTDNNGTIDAAELRDCLKRLGATMTEEEVTSMFQLSAKQSKNKLTFKEFVTALCIGAVLKMFPDQTTNGEASGESKTEEAGGVRDLLDALHHIVEAWMLFDRNGEGVIHKSDVDQALADSHAGSQKMKSSQHHLLSTERWSEMDFDADGFIVFPEFVISYMTWTGVDEDDDE